MRGTWRPPRAALYTRVSTSDQRHASQLRELEELAAARAWRVDVRAEDTASGAVRTRPGLESLLAAVRRGRVDVVAVWSLDRLARDVAHAVEIVEELGRLGVGLVTIRGELDTTSARGKFVFHIFAALAEMERELGRERTLAGLAAARARGVTLGRPSLELPLERVLDLRRAGFSIRAIAEDVGASVGSVHAAIAESRSKKGGRNAPRKGR